MLKQKPVTVDLIHLGRLRYEEAFAVQRARQQAVIEGEQPSALFLVEHPPVLTLGANFHAENLLFSEAEYLNDGVEVLKTDRGGDVTYHGPGQLVAYPVFDLTGLGKDLHLWLRNLEEVFIQAIADFGLTGRRFAPHTGVWVGDRKLVAFGVKVSRWVSIHGAALNCDNDLAPFNGIIPCGIHGYGVSSLTEELGRPVTVEEAEPAVLRAFQNVFGITFHAPESH